MWSLEDKDGLCLFHAIGPKQAASTSVLKSFMILHRFCLSVVWSFLCLQLFLEMILGWGFFLFITIGYAELITQAWLISDYSLKVST